MELWGLTARGFGELAQSFCEDGELELWVREPVRGRAAIVELLGAAVAAPNATAQASVVKRIVRHNVTNIRFTDVAPDEARVACYFTVFTEIGLDHYGRYRDVFVPVDDDWLIRHRFVSMDWSAADSTMARYAKVGEWAQFLREGCRSSRITTMG
jgi:hypothetical protein